MIEIRIILKGHVTFQNQFNSSAGYRYDVPTDEMGIPYLPCELFLADKIKKIPSVQVGRARPAGYLGMLREAQKLIEFVERGKEYIRSCFTEDRFDPEGGYRFRYLKAEQVFLAPIRYSAPSDLTALEEILGGISRIGETNEDIRGEAEFSLTDVAEVAERKQTVMDGCTYCALDYSALLLSPTVMQGPYQEADSYCYIPGSRVRQSLGKVISGLGEEVICTNAYLSQEGERLLPVPLCISYVKLDKEQTRYRLSPGKDPAIVEQDVSFSDTFTDDFQSHTMTCVKPEMEHISVKGKGIMDALAPGQVFSGRIYGSDEAVRTITESMEHNPYIIFDIGSEEKPEEVYFTVDRLHEEEVPVERLACSFDVVCISDTLLIDEQGMPSVQAEVFLKELERKLGASGRLAVVGKYTDVVMDYTDYYGWGRTGPGVRCLKMGSVFRIRTKDGAPVDLTPVLHAFVGERTLNGYGEIMAYPAKDQYYRIATYAAPEKYEKSYPLTIRNAQIGARFRTAFVTKVLESRIRGLAMTDKEEYLSGKDAYSLIPMELLSALRERYDPGMDRETMVRWYVEELKRHVR